MERESGHLGCDIKAAIAVLGCQKSLPFCIYGVCVGLCYRTWETHFLLEVGYGRIYRC